MSEPVYLDHHSATSPLPEVAEEFLRISKEYFGSPHSPHFVGQQGMYVLQKALDRLFEGLGAKDRDQIFFIKQDEGIGRLFFEVYAQVSRDTGKTLFLTGEGMQTRLKTIATDMQRVGCSHKTISLNERGQITKEALESVINSRTAMVSLSWADGLTGVIHPAQDLAAVCKEKGVLLHLDASYLLGKRFFRFQDVGVDFITLDGSMIQAFPETGILWVKEGSVVCLKEETFSVGAVSALALAVSERGSKFEHYCMETARLRDLFETKISDGFPDAKVLFREVDRLPETTVIAFPGIYNEALAYGLNGKGIYASIGGGKFDSIESVLRCAKVDPKTARSSLSFSLSWETSEEDVERAAEVIVSVALRMKKYSSGEE